MAQGPTLVIQTAFFGDLLLTIPLLKNLRRLDPESPVHLLCRAPFGSFFKNTGLVERAVEVNKRDRQSWKSGRELLKELSYKRIISPHKSLTSAFLARSLRSQERIGYKLWWNFWAFDKRIPRPLMYPEVIRQLWLLREWDPRLERDLLSYAKNFKATTALRLDRPPAPGHMNYVPDWASMELMDGSLIAEESLSADFLDERGQVERLWRDLGIEAPPQQTIALAPGSVWATKRWDKYRELATELLQQGWTVVLVGAENESALCDEVSDGRMGIYNLAGLTSAAGSYWLLRKVRLLICNDSGAMHLASVAKLPTIALFGPTTLNIGYRPWQNRAVVLQKDLACRPCGLHGGKRCPLATHQCMKELSISDVLSAMRMILAETESSTSLPPNDQR